MYSTNCAQYEYGMQQVTFYLGLSVLLIPWKDSVLWSQFFYSHKFDTFGNKEHHILLSGIK